jgi:hypothetical protein
MPPRHRRNAQWLALRRLEQNLHLTAPDLVATFDRWTAVEAAPAGQISAAACRGRRAATVLVAVIAVESVAFAALTSAGAAWLAVASSWAAVSLLAVARAFRSSWVRQEPRLLRAPVASSRHRGTDRTPGRR